jgi:hypothetical protein
METTPQTSWAAATTEKNARFWVLPRPTVAAAATLIAPAATLASAIADSTRARFRSGSALGPLAGTGRDTGLVSLSTRSLLTSLPLLVLLLDFSPGRYYRRDGDPGFPRPTDVDQSISLD